MVLLLNHIGIKECPMNFRSLIDRIGTWIQRKIQSKEVKEHLKEHYPTESQESDEPSGVSRVRNKYLDTFADRLLTYIIILVLIIGTTAVIDAVLCGILPNQIFGLLISVFGSVVLGRSLLKGPYTIVGSRGTGSSQQIENNLVESSVDGVFGISLLILGFIVQILFSFGISISPPLCVF